MRMSACFGLIVAAISALAIVIGEPTASARAEPVEFYKGRNLVLGVPNAAGGGYDVYARALARHLHRHIPGRPNIVVQNVPAGGGLALANQLATTAPKDGSFVAMIRGTAVQEQIFKSPQVQFDARRFAWIGNMNSDYDACAVGARSPVKSVEDFYRVETVVGASGVGAQSYSLPVAYRDLLGMKFKVVAGFPGTPERMLAVERGELDGFCGITLSTFRSQLAAQAKRGDIRLIVQAGTRNDPRYPDLPNIFDQAKTEALRQALEFMFIPLRLGRTLAAPPEIPADRLAILRQAVHDAMRDKEFLAEAERLAIDVEPMNAEETAKTVQRLFATPADAVARVRATLGPQ